MGFWNSLDWRIRYEHACTASKMGEVILAVGRVGGVSRAVALRRDLVQHQGVPFSTRGRKRDGGAIAKRVVMGIRGGFLEARGFGIRGRYHRRNSSGAHFGMASGREPGGESGAPDAA